ncbi:FAS1-like dehydratase domain-containing protein [Paeniglutamicibacter antarcticus]|uniref:FAS1-like dehydratase domain-containing protein n=1 Tax=Paeniglutamicibacter antarcticus TaxID=494023 RepID=A0ABP9TQW1_9MICC
MSKDPTTRIGEIIAAGHERVSVARDEVNRPMINHLCDAMGERNPIYLDPEAARAAGHTDVVSPPSALQVWNMINPSDPEIESDVDHAYAILAECGYPSVVAVNCDQEYDRYLLPGDVLTATEKVETFVGPKQTGLGEGYFITTLTTYTDQESKRVGTMRFRTLWYNPAKGN